MKRTVYVLCLLLASFPTWAQKKKAIDPVEQMKSKVLQLVQGKEKNVQEMVDMVFSFGELGFQEIETSKYLTDVLEKNGFTIVATNHYMHCLARYYSARLPCHVENELLQFAHTAII